MHKYSLFESGQATIEDSFEDLLNDKQLAEHLAHLNDMEDMQCAEGIAFIKVGRRRDGGREGANGTYR